MIKLITILWPACIPIVLYQCFRLWCSYRAAQGQTVPALSRYRFIAILLSLAMAISLLLLFGINQTRNNSGHYRAASFSHGILQEGHFE